MRSGIRRADSQGASGRSLPLTAASAAPRNSGLERGQGPLASAVVSARTTEENVMVANIKSVAGRHHPGILRGERRFSALPYALSLAGQAGAHLTVQAASLKLVLAHPVRQLLRGGARRLGEPPPSGARGGGRRAHPRRCTGGGRYLRERGSLAQLSRSSRRFHAAGPPQRSDGARCGASGAFRGSRAHRGGRHRERAPAPGRSPKCETFRAEGILVAWDGSAKAARAVNDALPFLRNARWVELVSSRGRRTFRTRSGAPRSRRISHGTA
jgi:hypothetical protein